jgi:NADH-quinone oxidoreductase subunit H
MALGWKLLIPASLAWLMIVALTNSIAGQGNSTLCTSLAGAVAIVAAVFVTTLRARLRARRDRAPDPAPFLIVHRKEIDV